MKFPFFLLLIIVLGSPVHVLAQTKTENDETWYRYNRITEDYIIRKDGSVEVRKLLTMLYSGSFHSMWRALPDVPSTVVTEVEVYDGSTGEPFVRVSEPLDANDQASWGKYVVYRKDDAVHVEWYYNTQNRVHTWGLRYVLRGAVTYNLDHDALQRDFFSGFDAPVDTVEATVTLPGAITEPRSSIFTTGGHDFYIDRPDDMTYRFRVSDIEAGERVAIDIGWQKGLVRPRVPSIFLWVVHPSARPTAALAGSLVVLGLIVLFFRPMGIPMRPLKKYFQPLRSLMNTAFGRIRRHLFWK